MSRPFCKHGIDGFFKCKEGCHNGDPVADYEELDQNIDYFFKRLNAHGTEGDPDHDRASTRRI